MAETDKLFAGPIPKLYDSLMVPLIFEEYAQEVAAGYRVVRFPQVPDVADVRPAVIPAVLADVPADHSPQPVDAMPNDSLRAAGR